MKHPETYSDTPILSASDTTELSSASAVYFCSLGNNYKDQGKLDDAIACFLRAVEQNPEHAAAYNNLGNAYKFKNDLDNALFYYRKALQTNPQYADACYNLAILFNEIGRFQEAVTAYSHALRLNPKMIEAHFNLGNIFRELGQLEEAIKCYQKALEINPDFAEAYNGLGTVYQEQGLLKKANASYQQHLRIKSDDGVTVKASLLMDVICESKQSILNSRDTISKNIEILYNRPLQLTDPSRQIGKTNFLLAYHGLDNRELQEKFAQFYLNACPELGWQAPLKQLNRNPNGKIKIGFISRYLRSHTIGYLNYGLIKHLDRQKFHLTVFRFPGITDKLSLEIVNAADQAVGLPTQLAPARQLIARQELDVLFYLDIGMDPLTYFLAFSRLAPVQCTTWGHPDTTGIPNMDYYISSIKAEPPGAPDQYSEKLILFNQFPMFCHLPDQPRHSMQRADLNFPQDRTLYACVQSLYKIHPDFDDLIAGILRHDPKGLVLLFEDKHAHRGRLLRKRFARKLPDVCDRVWFLKRLPRDEFMAFLNTADVLIDTHHFSGGYTSLLALASGTPIVTWPGEFMRGRLTYSFYKSIQTLDTVAHSREDYIQIACKLAHDRLWAEEIRDKIKTRAGCLYENPETVYELEDFFLWARQKAARVKTQ